MDSKRFVHMKTFENTYQFESRVRTHAKIEYYGICMVDAILFSRNVNESFSYFVTIQHIMTGESERIDKLHEKGIGWRNHSFRGQLWNH